MTRHFDDGEDASLVDEFLRATGQPSINWCGGDVGRAAHAILYQFKKLREEIDRLRSRT